MLLLTLIIICIYAFSLWLRNSRVGEPHRYRRGLIRVTIGYILFYVAITFLLRRSSEREIVLTPFIGFIERIQFCLRWQMYLRYMILAVLEVPLISGYLVGRATPMEGMLLNILLYVPAGALYVAFNPDRATWKKAFRMGLAISLLTEVIQLATGRGWFDINDILANTIGAVVGAVWIKRRLSGRG